MAKKRLLTCASHSNVKRIVTKREEFTQSVTSALIVCLCKEWIFNWANKGSTHMRVNIIGLNPVWVDIGLVCVWDFIFRSLTLVFTGCDLNSIGVICLSKAKTGTCRSWVCPHWNQENSIRLHPNCMWGRDSSVCMEGLGLGHSTTGGIAQGHAFQDAEFTCPGSEKNTVSSSPCCSCLYW